jgi:hypothetical protein
MRSRFFRSVSSAVALAACATGTLAGSEDINPSPDGGVAPAEDGASDGTVVDTGTTESPDTGSESSVASHDAGESGADAATDSSPPTDAPADVPFDALLDALPDAFDAADASCGVPPDGGLPGGSYSATCSGCTVTGTTLSCACQNDGQTYVPASLNLCTCMQPLVINNLNGVLTCG